jgi:hypothetical protein
MKTDAQIIDDLGGPAKVAGILKFRPESGTQRVQNWKVRGIPSDIRLKHLDLFGFPSGNDKNRRLRDSRLNPNPSPP